MTKASVQPGELRELRHRFGPQINGLVNALGQPTTQVYPSGYVGTVERSIETLESALTDGGFTWDPVSMYHRSPTGSTADGSWVYRDSPLADRQLHVVLFSQSYNGWTDVYAHEEFSWLRHPIKHAKEERITREEGVAETRRWLDDAGIAYRTHSNLRRKARQAVKRAHERLVDGGRQLGHPKLETPAVSAVFERL
ncbi:hypothetical protein KTS45_11740 [Halomicroarcula limicola]|uniref:Uncharacterized protein n=1 Tax=Haloarcula limicola TaxID=1429915 RepID=A0A8J7Y509_9EURY|nr:hypothetical protein [Halomicroarcula limicola]MBV0924870.1 hypothetical protein [Halomicroarcula limicola]